MNTHEKGQAREDMAVAYLESKGYTISDRNFRCAFGEIDIIANKEGMLIFVEVKYRKNARTQHPLASVGPKKQEKISRCAIYYMYRHKLPEDTPCRFDVISILGDEISHFRDAFPFYPVRS